MKLIDRFAHRPQRFAQFRGYLGTSSGSQSVQFRAIEAMSGMRDAHFLQVLKQHGEIAPLVKKALSKPTLQQLYDDLLEKLERRTSTVTNGE